MKLRDDCFQSCLYTTIPSVVESNAWPKTSTINNQENGKEVILIKRGDVQLQECQFDFYTIFVDADKIGEDRLFCRSVTAGVKTQNLLGYT